MGTWLKQTPLINASYQAHFELVKAMLEKVPKLNINKGD